MSIENKISPFKNWRVWVAVLVLPIVGFAAWRGGLMVYGEFLKWRSDRLALEASEFLAAGKSTEGRVAVTKSLDCNPSNPGALRLLATLQVDSGEDLAAMESYKKLSATRDFTSADAQNYARLAGRLKEWEVADRLLKALRAGPPSVETLLLESDLALLRGENSRAEACLRKAASLDATPKSRERLADFLIKHRLDHQTTPEVHALLVQTNRLQTPVGAQFLATAMEKNLAPPVEVPTWIQELRGHPNRSASMLLAADTAEIRRDPSTKPRVASELFSRLQDAPLEDRQAGMFWLLGHGESVRAADLIQQREAVQDAGLFNAWLDALAKANRPAEVLQALGTPGNPLPEWRKALQRGRALRLSGRRNNEVAAAYRQALMQAQAQQASALQAVAFFGQAGERESFESGLSQLLLDPAQNKQAFRTLMPIVRGWRDTVALRRFCEFLAAAPGLSDEQRLQLENEIAYCNLVLGGKVDAAALESRSAAHPGDMRYQTTRALAMLRQGKNEQAVEELVITQAPPEDPFLLARHKALQAMTLAANGDRERAEIHFAGLTEEFLSPQESALVRSFLKKTSR